MILQHVENDATSLSLKRSLSFDVIHSVAQGDYQVAEQDVDNDKDQGHAMGNVHEYIAVEELREIHVCLVVSLLI